MQELLLCMVAGHVHGRLWGDKDDEEDGDKNVDEDENEDGGDGMMITTVQQRHTPTQKKNAMPRQFGAGADAGAGAALSKHSLQAQRPDSMHTTWLHCCWSNGHGWP